jgi:hypothetical protein
MLSIGALHFEPYRTTEEAIMKLGLVLTLRVLLLFVVVMGCFMVAGAASSLAGGSGASDPAVRADAAGAAASMLGALLLMCGLVSLVVSGIVLRARASGWQLAAALSLATFGLMTFLYYIEARVFLRTRMSPGNMNGMLAMGVVYSVLLGPLAVWILGRWRRSSAAVSQTVAFPAGSWIWKLAAIGVSYVALYMAFGYFVAWQNPALRAYYGGTDPGSFVGSMRQNWVNTPWIFPLQFGRGILWALFLVPLIRAFRRSPAETGFAMAMFSAVWCLQLLFPNPYMPADIRRSHLVETLGSNLIFGFGVGWLLSHRGTSVMKTPSPSSRTEVAKS